MAEPRTVTAWNATGLHVHHKVLTHSSFYWGHTTQVLFSGWPGSNKAMYAVALIFVFSLAVLVEGFSHSDVVKPGVNRVAKVLFEGGMCGVRAGLAYLVILAVASFNGGVFIAAVLGHAVGRVLFGGRVFGKSGGSGSNKA
ncbi:hypothetical protein HS088_TW13G00081 [Tripterygium wilfordii]|uniref:Copper transport protein n=1 Tax=Tripterygium wilfordii TaxID=458696 RepID=A0A7J7CSZ0_TRIWF|nr:copper transporter 4 [Tripterygium wilfordii]KAF5737203.1 hypothetical protein HS088_TW13G00081 [Tripterygium wilfordii]